jgi:hypothetical protein
VSDCRPRTVRRPTSCRVPLDNARNRRTSPVPASESPSVPHAAARVNPGKVASPAKVGDAHSRHRVGGARVR